MKRIWRELKPRNTVEGLVMILSLALVLATAVLVVGSKKVVLPPTDDPQSEVRLEARETTPNPSSSQPTQKAKANSEFSVLSHRIAGSMDTWQRNLPDKAEAFVRDLNLAQQLPREILEKFQRQEALFGKKPDSKKAEDIDKIMSDAEGLAIAETNVAPAVENPPSHPVSPPAVQATMPRQTSPAPSATVENSPYAPTAAPAKDNPDNNANLYAPTAPQASGDARPTNLYAPAPPTSPDQENQAEGPAYAPPADQNPATNPTIMPSSQQVAQVQAEVMAKINAARIAAGIPALQANGTIQGIANFRAQELSAYYHPKHFRPDGSYALTWIANNWGGNYGIGENIGWIDNVNSLNADTIFKAFYNSGKGHREIMLHPSLKIGAVGIYCVPGPVADNNTGSPNDSNKGRIFISMNFGY